jgi:D-cysteine desulfhydrase/L-cysteate sulfo-lyase
MPWPWSIPEALAHDANNVADMLGFPTRLTADDVDADENFIAPGYGLPSPAGHEAMRLMAKTEGVLVDPVYSAKALAGLISDVRAEKYPRNSVIVFIHTGGVPAIFGNPQSVQPL